MLHMPSHEPLVVAIRGDTVESVHYGSVAVADDAGRLLGFAGDTSAPTYTRSALKPLQALPFVLDGGPGRFGFDRRELALICASHSGEDRHLASVAAILSRVGCTAGDLRCGTHMPVWYAACGVPPPANIELTSLHHNCSGKHAGFLAYCRLHDLPTEGYLDPAHPLQRRIAALAAEFAGGALRSGTDGCGAPNHAMPLPALARFYARLAADREGALGAALAAIFEAMTGEPEMVSGRCRPDAALMGIAPGDWVAKGGAEGVQAIGIRSRRLGIAIKISDGSAAALRVATAAVLLELGLVDEDRLPPDWAQIELRNNAGRPVGRMQAVFALKAGAGAAAGSQRDVQ
ncbi:MAG TPA: asparaginase [Rhodocyclaceae bacterium]|nr:asparaginase [Rhodocyclaceae bacterium]